jgi:acyl-coenzyme A synthetase/AMP-(fatty) acid ligase
VNARPAREKVGPVASFKLAITVARLPMTCSGKILRGTIKKIAGRALADAGDDRRSGDSR